MNPLVCSHCHTACAPPPGYRGQPLLCPACGQLMSSAVAPMAVPMALPYVAGEAPLASPVAPPGFAHSDAENAEIIEEELAAVDAPRHRRGVLSWLMLITFLLVCGMFLAAATAIGFAFVSRTGGSTDESIFGSSASTWSGNAAPAERWHSAQDRTLVVGPASVRVIRVEIGEARGKDAAGNVVISDGDYLQVLLRIENRTPVPLEYRSWYGNDFPISPSDTKNSLRVQLRDDANRPYSWVIFDDGERVRWHTPEATIPPRKSIDDVIVFQLPPGATKANLKTLRLELPAAAVGFRAGYFRFEIPRSMIEGLAS